MFGDYGAAKLKQAGNKLTGNAEGSLSVQDKIAKDKFISDFIGRASTNLNSAIQSGLVDPNIKAGAPGAVEPQQDATPVVTTDQQPSTPQQPATSAAPKTPAEIQKEKLAAAAKVAQDQMANNPAPAPGAPAQPTQPAGQAKMTPQQVAAKKAELLSKRAAGKTIASQTGSGFKDYVGGSGERMTGVDKSGAPVYQKIQRESRYAKLDYILESIINIDEAQEAQSISEYLQNMFNQYLKVPITDPKAKAQIKTLADQAQSSYPKMTNALTQMANLGFAISYSQGSGATQDAGATTSKPQSALSSFASGFKQGATDTANEPTNTGSSTASTNEPVQGSSVYDQIMALVSKMSKDEQQRLLTSIAKYAPKADTEPKAEPTNTAGANAFDQMSKQLQQPKSTANKVDNRQQKLNTNKVKAGNKGGPTPDEEAKLQQRIQQQLAKQA